MSVRLLTETVPLILIRSPGGAAEPSPARKRWEPVCNMRGKPRRGDTSLPKNVFGVVIHAVLFQEDAQFILETRLSVVRFLVLDVSHDPVKI